MYTKILDWVVMIFLALLVVGNVVSYIFYFNWFEVLLDVFMALLLGGIFYGLNRFKH
jgi:hypothetical protein